MPKKGEKWPDINAHWSRGPNASEIKERMRQIKLERPVRYWLGKKRDPELMIRVKAGAEKWRKENPEEFAAIRFSATRHFIGEGNHRWRGGITIENSKQRTSLAGKRWRKAVLEKCNHTCQCCGQVGGDIQAAHIKQWLEYPELRFDIANGRALCRKCHFVETYGREMTPNCRWGRLPRSSSKRNQKEVSP